MIGSAFIMLRQFKFLEMMFHFDKLWRDKLPEIFSLLYSQCLEEYLTHIKWRISICWMEKKFCEIPGRHLHMWV